MENRSLNVNVMFLLLFILLPLTSKAQSIQPDTGEKLIGSVEKGYMSPRWSPDGSMIAFTSAKYKGIWIIELQNKNVKEITDEAAAGFQFKWSGNSQQILSRVAKYVQRTPDGEGFRRYNAVKIFNVENGNADLLTDYRTIMPGLPHFTSTNEKVYMYGKNNLEIFDSGIEANLKKTSSPSSKIIYIKGDKIAVEDLSNGSSEMFEPVKGERVINLHASPDNSKVAFEIYGGDMYSMNSDGTNLQDLGKGYRPQWGSDNQTIVYMITEDDGQEIISSDIYLIKADGTEKRNVSNTSDRLEMNPDLSPDGKKIAYDVLDEGAVFIMNSP